MVSEKKIKSKLEEQATSAGIDIVEVLKLAEPIIAQSVAKTINEMKLPDLISQTIEARVKERTDAIGAEVKEAVAQMQAAQPAQQPDQPQQPNQLQQMILATLAQKFIGDSTDSMDKFLEKMMKFQQVGAMMYQNPLAQAATMLTTMMKTAYSMGLEPQQVVKGMENLAIPNQPPQPNAQP